MNGDNQESSEEFFARLDKVLEDYTRLMAIYRPKTDLKLIQGGLSEQKEKPTT